ncbi:MAG: DUF998 domain-containing protein [Enterococcus sp.]
MFFLKKFGFYFLFLGVLIDFLTPYILGFFYPGINQLTAVISVFGEVGSPVKVPFMILSILSGIFFLLSLPALYTTFAHSSKLLAGVLAIGIGFYGLGDCIFSGLFHLNIKQEVWTISTWIHNISSGLGYSGLLIFPFLLFLLYHKEGDKSSSRFYLWLLGLSFFFGCIYALARIPTTIREFPILNKVGLCQRMSYFFSYLPVACLSISRIRKT